MSKDTLDAIHRLLEELLEETDDEEVHYKLKTVMQFLLVHEEDLKQLEGLGTDDSELHARLNELEYFD